MADEPDDNEQDENAKPKSSSNGAADPSGPESTPNSTSERSERGVENPRASSVPESSRRLEKKRPSGKSPWPSAHKSEQPPAPSVAPVAATTTPKAEWGEPLAKLDRKWMRLESRLAAAVLVAEVATLVFWIGIRALSTTGHGGPGMVFRVLLFALLFGVIAYRAAKQHPRREHITTAGVLLGGVFGTQLGELGTTYFSNLFAWLQNASILVFVGGVGELARRLTLWLALLGASLATAQGKHINVDVLMRFLSPKARVPVAVLGWVAAAVVTISASWGFFDFVAVEELRAPPTIECPDGLQENGIPKRCPAPPGSKVDRVLTAAKRDAFLVGRQLTLDLRSFPRVITGTPYNKWMTPADWNQWLRGGGWEEHFKAEDVKAFELPEDGTIDYRNPSVTAVPGGTMQIPGILVPLFDLVFAFGLLVIGIRFLLRSALALGGWVKVDPAAAHGDDELAHAHDPSPAAELAEAAIKGTHT